ncbi:MAG: hypothetical protein VKL42_01555 [Snowella sp.]|nr:hypothetical protein [Snowella sp.]
MDDELRSEYDLKTLKVRKMGTNRRKFGDTVIRLDADVAEVFTSAESVNEALRFLITITKDNQNKIQDLLANPQ